MSDSQRLIPWLTLVLLTVVGVGGAALGIQQSSANASLTDAVSNTLKAPNYTTLLQVAGTQAQTQFLVWQAPDRLGGYIDAQGKRLYVRVVGTTEYQSTRVTASANPEGLTFSKEPSQAASSYNPVFAYLPYVKQAKHITQNGDQYSFDVTQQGQVGHFVYTVTGQYVSNLKLTTSGATLNLAISSIGTSPAVTLPTKVSTGTASPSA